MNTHDSPKDMYIHNLCIILQNYLTCRTQK